MQLRKMSESYSILSKTVEVFYLEMLTGDASTNLESHHEYSDDSRVWVTLMAVFMACQAQACPQCRIWLPSNLETFQGSY